MSCPICNYQISLDTRRLYDDRYGYRGEFSLERCSQCGHQFISERFTSDQLIDLYSNYYPRSSFDIDAHKVPEEPGGLSSWLNGDKSAVMYWVPRSVRVLDIGCGFGESLAYHKTRGCDVHGVEADLNIRRVANKFDYNIRVGLFDAANYEANTFDYVTMSQVIEHVTEPLVVLNGIATILKPGGCAILSTPNSSGWGARLFGKYWINWHTPYHLQFFTNQSMRLAAEQAGLVLDKTYTITPSAWLHFQWIHLLTCPVEGKPSVFWAPGGKWSFTQKAVLKGLSIVQMCKINHVITRIFDALGYGDNQIYFLRKP
jgi:2-polyprenyl-3-methyl-5-hydroxy-6-metoxy-1,4-benzoquinol methylase